MNTDIAKTQTQELTNPGEIFGSEGIDNADLILPRIYLIQKMSPQIDDDNIVCEAGDLLNSLTNEVLVEPVLIPIFTKKFWKEALMDISVTPPEIKNATKFPFTHENCNLKYEEVPGEDTNLVVKRHIEIEWYCMLASEVAQGGALPCVVTFKKTSMPAGKKLNTFIKQGSILGRPACGFAYELKVARRSMEKGGKTLSFFVLDIGKKRDSTPDELSAAKSWYDTLVVQAAAAKVSVSEVREPEEAPF